MSETLTAAIVQSLTATLTNNAALGNTQTNAFSLPAFLSASFASGTGAGNINQFYTEQKTLAASGTRTLLLSTMSLATDPFGLAYALTNIKGFYLQILGNLGCTYVSAVAVQAGGSSYVAGDTVTVAGGTGTAATLKVITVSGGAITSISVLTPGSYTVNPSTSANAVTGGTGSSATINLTMSTVVAPATYVEGDYLTIGAAGSNPWTSLIGTSTSTLLLKSGTVGIPGTLSFTEGGATGWVVASGSNEQLKIVNSGSNPVTYLLVLLGATA